MSFDEDLKNVIYGDFSLLAKYNGFDIRVVYQDEKDQIDFFQGTVTDGGPVALCYPADVAGIQRGDIINVGGADFYVLDVQTVHLSATKVFLSKDNI